MKSLTRSRLYFAWTIAGLCAISIIPALAVSGWFFIATFFFAFWYVWIIFRLLHCPHCNKMESLINLTYAIDHEYYCRFCGQKIMIEKEK